MKAFKIFIVLLVVMGLWVGTGIAMSSEEQQANAELEALAKDVAQLCSTPGFRGFLRSEIAKSKNSENIIELDQFLSRAMKQKNMPPGLDKVKAKGQQAQGRLKGYSVADRLDLYIPAEAHRAKWKGGEDFLVAFSPTGKEEEIKQIVAYSVKDGKRVLLDPNSAPEAVVLVVAPCEHETHQDIVKAEPGTPEKGLRPPKKITSPPGKIGPNEKGDKEEIGKYPGNSRLYPYYAYIKNDREPWYKGSPEIEIYLMQECSGQRSFRRIDAPGVNDTYKVYYVAAYGYMNFDGNCSDVTIASLWERDGGSWIRGECYRFPSGKTHCTSVRDKDDWCMKGTAYSEGVFYKSAFPYDSVYFPPRMGVWGEVDVLKRH